MIRTGAIGVIGVVALIIGTIELMSVVTDKLSLHGAFWTSVANLDLNTVGYVIVGLFIATWAVALGVWRLARIEERWTAHVRQS